MVKNIAKNLGIDEKDLIKALTMSKVKINDATIEIPFNKKQCEYY